jgi:hypothetical protein
MSTRTRRDPAPVEWTTADVVAYLAEQGQPMSASGWRSYVARGQAPAPARRVGRTPVWDAAAVRAWQAARPGRDWRAGLSGPARRPPGAD